MAAHAAAREGVQRARRCLVAGATEHFIYFVIPGTNHGANTRSARRPAATSPTLTVTGLTFSSPDGFLLPPEAVDDRLPDVAVFGRDVATESDLNFMAADLRERAVPCLYEPS